MKKGMKKNLKNVFCVFGLLLFFGINQSYAVCNSPCDDPCAPSHTVCEGNNCTTYCNSSTAYVNTVYNVPRSYSFSYYTPFGSFRVSNSYVGVNVIAPPIHHRPMPVRPLGVQYGYPVYRPLKPAQPARPHVAGSTVIKTTNSGVKNTPRGKRQK